MNNKHKATWLLVFVSFGLLVSYPFHNTFVGGLLVGGFAAAMVGGIADWFAVSALFRRPLGIPYRTAIIPRNRERIFRSLAVMVEQELLMKENIKNRIREYDVAGTLLSILSGPEGRNILRRILYQFFRNMLTQIRQEDMELILDSMVKSAARSVNVSAYLIEGIKRLFQRGYDQKVLDLVLDWLISIVGTRQIRIWLAELFTSAIRQYEKGKNRRAFFDMFISLTPEDFAAIGQKRIICFLEGLKQPDTPLRQEFSKWVEGWLKGRQENSAFFHQFQSCVDEFIMNTQAGRMFAPHIAVLINQATSDMRQSIRWLEQIFYCIDRGMDRLMENEEEKARLDDYLKGLISELLDLYHQEIGRMVLDSLDAFSDDMLIEFVENKAGNDLQMIRINGSVVGGLAGVLLYLATFWL